MPADAARGVHVVVRGLVQGVGYRYTLQREAGRAGLAGWVRNRRDGSVEAVLEGAAEAVDAVLGWMAHGPPGAVVDATEVTDARPEGVQGFDVRATV